MTSIPLFKVHMNEKAPSMVGEVLSSGMITQAGKVEEFEDKLKKWFDHPYILTLNSATSGLTLAYRLFTDETCGQVISTPLTCFATNAAILANNLTIVWADTDPTTCNIDLESVKSKITSSTRILTFVHWGGVPVDLDKVEELKQYAYDKYETVLNVVEDCAHAFGAEWRGKKLGTSTSKNLGQNIAVYSLQAIKHLTTGDGGLIVLPTKELYDRAKLLRWYGIDRERRSKPGADFRLEPDIPEFGYKFHMNDINATIGLANLPDISGLLEKCRINGRYYRENLHSIPYIELFKVPEHSTPSYWIYTIKVTHGFKQYFTEFMQEKGIVVSQVHARNDNHTCVNPNKVDQNLRNLDKLEKEIISIPVGWWVTKQSREYIVDCIKEFSASISLYITNLNPKDSTCYLRLLKQLNNHDPVDSKLPEKWEEMCKSIWVLKVGADILSTAKLHIENKVYDPVAHIEDVVTDYNHRGNGYGKALVKHLIRVGIEQGCYKVVLSCDDKLDGFYESCGLTRSGSSFEFRRR